MSSGHHPFYGVVRHKIRIIDERFYIVSWFTANGMGS